MAPRRQQQQQRAHSPSCCRTAVVNLLSTVGLLFAAVSSATSEVTPSVVRSGFYIRSGHCVGQALAEEHQLRTLGARSILHCANLCDGVTWCQSFDFDRQLLFCHLAESKAAINCSNMVTSQLVHFEKVSKPFLIKSLRPLLAHRPTI